MQNDGSHTKLPRIASLLFLLVITIVSFGCGSSRDDLTPAPGNPGQPGNLPVITMFAISPDAIQSGQAATLNWATTNATSVTITGVNGTLPTSGSVQVAPAESSSYTLSATGPGGTATSAVFLTVTTTPPPPPPVITSFTASATTINLGQSVTLTWTTQNAEEVLISGVTGELPANGSVTVTPQTTGDYTLTAVGPNEMNGVTSTIRITVNAAVVINTFKAEPSAVTPGGQSTLTWDVVGAAKVTINGVEKTATGTEAVTPASTTTYSLVATAADGTTVNKDVIVTVGTGTNAGLKKINHIIFMVQENRSFDQYFGKLNDYRVKQGLPPSIDGLTDAMFNASYDESFNIAPFHMRTQCMENTTPSWDDAHVQRNRHHPSCTADNCSPALMDGFARDAAANARSNSYFDKEGYRAMGYYTEEDLPYYYFMATQFATSNRFFAPLMGRTQPNLLFLFAATSGGYVNAPTTGDPTLPDKTIFQLLEEAGISWKFYMPEGSESNVVFTFQPFTNQHRDKFVPHSQYFDDLKNNTLPAVAFIASKPGFDEHPGPANLKFDPSVPTKDVGIRMQWGAIYVSNIINALMQSSSWKDSIFIWSMDEWGGTYDHVPPMKSVPPDDRPPIFKGTQTPGDFSYTGFRIPMFVVSPFTKKGYVSNTPMDSTAILKLIEERFDLPSLTRRDAAQPSMTEFFDFDNPSWMTPPTPPVQPGNGLCDRTQIP